MCFPVKELTITKLRTSNELVELIQFAPVYNKYIVTSDVGDEPAKVFYYITMLNLSCRCAGNHLEPEECSCNTLAFIFMFRNTQIYSTLFVA